MKDKRYRPERDGEKVPMKPRPGGATTMPMKPGSGPTKPMKPGMVYTQPFPMPGDTPMNKDMAAKKEALRRMKGNR